MDRPDQSAVAPVRLPWVLYHPEANEFRRACGRTLEWWPQIERAEVLLVGDWSIETIREIGGLLKFAEEAGTAVTRLPSALTAMSVVSEATSGAALNGRSAKFTVDWLRALVAAPTAEAVDTLHRSLEHGGRGLLGWSERLGSQTGALAWAAGLSRSEAHDRLAAGTLEPDALLTLAGLRGFRFPPIHSTESA